MFKVTINQIDTDKNEEIVINCHEINDEVLKIVEKLKKSETVLLGSKDSEMFQIELKDIYYIESVDNKTYICMQKNVFESKLKLYEVEEIIKNTKLFRCSKAMILNLSKIRSVSPSVNGRFEAKLLNGESVIISRQYVPNLKKLLGMWGIVMKDAIKLVVEHFFMITVGVLFFTSIGNIGAESIPPNYPWMVLLSGIAGAIPTLLFYFRSEPTKKQFIIRVILHFIVIVALIMTLGFVFGWYTNLLEGLIILGVILAVYASVWILSYKLNASQAKNINDALNRINDDE